jgi:hypothetical protein
MPDGTLALRWLVGHWRGTSPEQRAAAAALVPELGWLEPPPPASGGPGLGMVAAGRLGGELAAALDAVYVAQKRSDLFYTGIAEQIAGEIASSGRGPRDPDRGPRGADAAGDVRR